MVGIVFIQDIRYCPYLGRYTQPLKEAGVPFDLIWWERWKTPPTTPLPEVAEGAQAYYAFTRYSEMSRNPASKLGDFAAFSRYIRDVIRRRKYEKLIVLTTMTGMLLTDLLTGRYRKRFIYDIRDYSYERFGLYKSIEARIVDASAFTCISSEGFLEFLPRDREYVVADNFVDSDIRAAEGMRFHKKAPGKPLRLSYVGFVRYFQENRKILDALIDDPRFLLSYHGTGADYDRLVEYQRQHQQLLPAHAGDSAPCHHEQSLRRNHLPPAAAGVHRHLLPEAGRGLGRGLRPEHRSERFCRPALRLLSSARRG